MQKISIILLISFLIDFSAFARQQITFNHGWYHKKGSEFAYLFRGLGEKKDWSVVTLPHTWNERDYLDDEPGYYRGVGFYGKGFSYKELPAGDRVFIRFEGVMKTTEVYLNGHFVGSHKGGYTAFQFPIQDFIIKDQPNFLFIKVDNGNTPPIAPISGDFNEYGGIYRDVYLIGVNSLSFDMEDFGSTGIYLTPISCNEQKAEVNAKSQLSNSSNEDKKIVLTHQIFDKTGKPVFKFEKNLTLKKNSTFEDVSKLSIVANLKLWSPESPSVYRVVSSITEKGKTVDEVTNPLGFRTVIVDVTGFYLNGKKTKLWGVNRHQDYPFYGNALSDEMHRRDARLIKEGGFNFVRISHYPQDPAFHQTFDELGIITWEEIPIVNEITDTKDFFENSKIQYTEMVKQHFNHPSIAMWGYMNEVLLKRNSSKEMNTHLWKRTEILAKELESIGKKLDPHRYSVTANHGSLIYDTVGTSQVVDIVGWNIYFGWYGNDWNRFGTMMDEQHKSFPNRPIIIAEYGAGGDKRLNSYKPERFDFTIQWQQLYLKSYYRQMLTRDFIIGSAEWNFIDFGSEGRKESRPHINNKGLVYYDRTPKDVYYWYQAVLKKEKMGRIATRDWNIRSVVTDEKTATLPVPIFSNFEKVKLLCNEKEVGIQKTDTGMTVFSVPVSNGDNLLELFGEENGKWKKIDVYTLNVRFTPKTLSKSDFDVIAINCGTNVEFMNEAEDLIYQADRAYEKGSFGRIGGQNVLTSFRIGTTADIIGTQHDPLFQTCSEGMDAYRFDVAPGVYEVTLGFADINSRVTQKMINDVGEEAPALDRSDREFSVFINDQMLLENFKIKEVVGLETASIHKTKITVTDQNGLNISFKATKGAGIVNMIVLRKLSY